MHPVKPKKHLFASVLLAFSLFAMSMIFTQANYEDQTPEFVAQRFSKHVFANTLHKQETTAMYGRRIYLVREDDELHDSAEDEDEVIFVEEKTGMMAECLYVAPSDAVYEGELVDVVISDEAIGPGEEFAVTVTVLNTGTAPWFKNNYCENQVEVNLATAADYGRSSVFGGEMTAVSGWLNDSRIEMAENFVYPEETATFTFTSKAPWGDVWYKEFFAPVAEGVRWIDEAVAAVDIKVGFTDGIDAGIMDVISFTTDSTEFDGLEKWIHVDLSDQQMTLFVGEVAIYELPVSTGAYDTPTPTGTYSILNKQELRVGGDWPHYHMPNWMGFTKWGHGLHALPYLATDGGAFWYEALDHIGIPVSHGCIRQLPDDSEIVYAFGEVGMSLVIEN